MSQTISGETFFVPVMLTAGSVQSWPLSKRLDIKRRLCAHLEGITQANGYEFDLKPGPNKHGRTMPRVVRGRLVFGDDDPTPLVSVNEAPTLETVSRFADDGEQVQANELELQIQGWAEMPDDNPTDLADQLLACVKKRLSAIVTRGTTRSGLPANPELYMLGGRIAGLRIGAGVVRPPQDGVSSVAFFYLPVVVTLGEDVSQPFVTA